MGKNGLQVVRVIIEASRDPLDAFSAVADTQRPEGAEVSDVIIKDFEGFVPRMVDFALRIKYSETNHTHNIRILSQN